MATAAPLASTYSVLLPLISSIYYLVILTKYRKCNQPLTGLINRDHLQQFLRTNYFPLFFPAVSSTDATYRRETKMKKKSLDPDKRKQPQTEQNVEKCNSVNRQISGLSQARCQSVSRRRVWSHTMEWYGTRREPTHLGWYPIPWNVTP